MRQGFPSRLTTILGVLIALILVGLTISVVIVKQEGLDGLFPRKRMAVETVAPDALPILDKVEKRVRQDHSRNPP